MTKSETKRLISAVGGDTAFARLLGIQKQVGAVQRINNWKRRGMPAAVELEHYEKIQELKSRLLRRGISPPPSSNTAAA